LRICLKTHEKKKAKILDEEQVMDFMTKAPNENKYYLVRKAVVVVNIYGGLRGKELRDLDRSNVKSTTKGYKITYLVSKGLKEKKWNT
jgi:integrase